MSYDADTGGSIGSGKEAAMERAAKAAEQEKADKENRKAKERSSGPKKNRGGAQAVDVMGKDAFAPYQDTVRAAKNEAKKKMKAKKKRSYYDGSM